MAGSRLAACVGDYLVMLSFVKRYLRKYKRSEIKTFRVGTLWLDGRLMMRLINS